MTDAPTEYTYFVTYPRNFGNEYFVHRISIEEAAVFREECLARRTGNFDWDEIGEDRALELAEQIPTEAREEGRQHYGGWAPDDRPEPPLDAELASDGDTDDDADEVLWERGRRLDDVAATVPTGWTCNKVDDDDGLRLYAWRIVDEDTLAVQSGACVRVTVDDDLTLTYGFSDHAVEWQHWDEAVDEYDRQVADDED